MDKTEKTASPNCRGLVSLGAFVVVFFHRKGEGSVGWRNVQCFNGRCFENISSNTGVVKKDSHVF